MKALPLMLIAAAAFWIASELLELLLGGRSTGSLWLTATFHLLMVFGIWGAYRGPGVPRGRLALVAALLVSLGYLVVVCPPIAVALAPDLTIEAFMEANPLFKAAGLAAVLGKVMFGMSILRTRIDPAWTGIMLTVGPLLFATVVLSGGPTAIAIAANLCVSVALIVIGVRALRHSTSGP